MNNKLHVFNNEHFGQVRVITKNNEPWLCLKDICNSLDIKNVSDCKSRLNPKGVVNSDTLTSGGCQKLTYVNESNFYKVIFQSRKSGAEKFTEWVTSEVLPTIRKSGAYMTDDTLEKALTSPDFLIRLATELKSEKEQRQALEDERKINAPKVVFADAVATSNSSILVGELAKLLKQNGIDTGQNKLFNYLRENGYLIRRKGNDYNLPTQKSMEMGLFEIKETSIAHADGHITINKTPKVTGKGQQYFINKFINKED